MSLQSASQGTQQNPGPPDPQRASESPLYALRVPTKGLMQSQSGCGLLLPSPGRDVARVARAEMRTKQKTPFAAIFPWKCFFRGDLRPAAAEAGLMRNMVVDAFS